MNRIPRPAVPQGLPLAALVLLALAAPAAAALPSPEPALAGSHGVAALHRPQDTATKKKTAKKTKPPKAPAKRAAAIDEGTEPTKPKRKVSAVERIQFRDAILAGLRGRHTAEPALAEKLADDLSEYYATGQISADEVNRIRDAMRGFLDTERPSHGDIDGLAGQVNAVTEGSNLDVADMEAIAADIHAVAESVRVETPKAAAKKADASQGGHRRRGFFHRLFR